MLQYGHIAAHLSSLGLQINIQTVRLPRQAQKRVLFAFAEFGTEEKCEEAKVRVIIPIVVFKYSRHLYRFKPCLLFLHKFF